MERISYTAAAQRLGCSVEEIEQKVKEGILSEYEPRTVSKEAVYALNGIKLDGKQSKDTAQPKKDKKMTETMSLESAASFLDMDVEEVQKLIKGHAIETAEDNKGKTVPTMESVKQFQHNFIPLDEAPKSVQDEHKKETNEGKPFDLDACMHELFEGMRCFSKEERTEKLGETEETRQQFSRHDMKEISDMAMKMGRLQVYESMATFERITTKEKR